MVSVCVRSTAMLDALLPENTSGMYYVNNGVSHPVKQRKSQDRQILASELQGMKKDDANENGYCL